MSKFRASVVPQRELPHHIPVIEMGVLEKRLLAPVSHRLVVLTISRMPRVGCLSRRRLLGALARVAARMLTAAAFRTLTGEREQASASSHPADGWCA